MTNPITISDIVIHQDCESRYSVNDLHKASGNEQRHQPRYWLALQQTSELIEEIVNSGIALNTGNPVFEPATTRRGCRGGTYVCKELVYAYAMWVSAKFHLAVIRAYDSLVTTAPKTTVNERTPLRDAVNLLVSKRSLPYDEAYSLIHQRFGVESIENLKPETLPAAIEYVHRLALEGELLEREKSPAIPIFPIGIDFQYLTTVSGGQVIDIRIGQPGETFICFESYQEMCARAGYVTMPHEALRSLSSAEIVDACNAASRQQTKWGKIYAR
jgi:hypothetical protein